MKKFLVLLALCVVPLCVAQTTFKPLNDDVYWASKDPQVKALCSLPDMSSRESKALALDAAGLVIDRAINIWCWDPTIVMMYRAQLGYPWLPNAFQPNLVDPLKTGVVPVGSVPTDMSKPWPRSIKVSVNAADYPPLAPPPPPPAASNGLVLTNNGDGTYAAGAAVYGVNGQWLFKEGDPISYNGKTLYFHLSPSIMGYFPQWLEKAPVK